VGQGAQGSGSLPPVAAAAVDPDRRLLRLNLSAESDCDAILLLALGLQNLASRAEQLWRHV
jgi:hypothetical protein